MTTTTAPAPKAAKLATRKHLTPDEVARLVAASKRVGRYGQRDALLILMAYRHGFRAAEVLDLRWDDLDFASGKLHVRRKKHGDDSVQYLEGDQLRALRSLQRHATGPFVFCSERHGPLSGRVFRDIVARAGTVAGFPFRVHPHMLRHAKGYALANAGVDTRTIQAYLGHRNIQHTVRYTQLDASRFKGLTKI